MAGFRGGGVPGGHRTPPPPPPPTSHSTAIYKCRSIQISFRLGELRRVKMANSFWGGGGCQRKSKLCGKLRLFLIIDYQGQSKTDIYAVFLFRDPPPPHVRSGSAPVSPTARSHDMQSCLALGLAKGLAKG